MSDPSIGRRLTEDPKGFEAGDANLYRYAGNDPTNAIDPQGADIVEITTRTKEGVSGPNLDAVRTALREGNTAIMDRLRQVIAELDKALAKPRPKEPHPFSTAAIAAREVKAGNLCEGEVEAFKVDYEWALERARDKLTRIRKEMESKEGYSVAYFGYDTKIHGRTLVTHDFTGLVSEQHGDYRDRLINITQVCFDPKDERFTEAKDPRAAVTLQRRNTMLHELSHLVWDTEDYNFGSTEPYPDKHVSKRVLDDSYWYGNFYKTDSMRNDFAINMDRLIADMVRRSYRNWLNDPQEKHSEWLKRYVDPKDVSIGREPR
jgi:hypothetical protein